MYVQSAYRQPLSDVCPISLIRHLITVYNLVELLHNLLLPKILFVKPSVMVLSWDAAASEEICACLPDSGE